MSQTISDTVLSALAAAYFGGVAAQGPATLYAAFFIGATGPLTGGTEAAGGNYSRTAKTNNQANFAAPTGSGGTLTVLNGTDIVGPRSTAAWGTVNCVRFYSASSGGTLLGGAILTPTVSVDAAGITITLEAGAVSIVLASS